LTFKGRIVSTAHVHPFVRLFLCAVLSGLFAACSSSNRPSDPTGDLPDAMVDGGDAGRDAGRDGGPGPKPDGGKPPQAGTDDAPPAGPSGPTSISTTSGSAVGRSDNYRLQVVVGAPAPMNEGKSDNFKLRIGARLQ
jgi:hypothetical protein